MSSLGFLVEGGVEWTGGETGAQVARGETGAHVGRGAVTDEAARGGEETGGSIGALGAASAVDLLAFVGGSLFVCFSS